MKESICRLDGIVVCYTKHYVCAVAIFHRLIIIFDVSFFYFSRAFHTYTMHTYGVCSGFIQKPSVRKEIYLIRSIFRSKLWVDAEKSQPPYTTESRRKSYLISWKIHFISASSPFSPCCSDALRTECIVGVLIPSEVTHRTIKYGAMRKYR